MKLTKKAIKALKKSIDHWEKDIIQKLRDGGKIVSRCSLLAWATDWYVIVKCYTGDCELCRLYFTYCERCPYFMFYGKVCSEERGGHWNRFARNPSLRNAVSMKKALQKILDSQGD